MHAIGRTVSAAHRAEASSADVSALLIVTVTLRRNASRLHALGNVVEESMREGRGSGLPRVRKASGPGSLSRTTSASACVLPHLRSRKGRFRS